jgi:hypothetical protein
MDPMRKKTRPDTSPKIDLADRLIAGILAPFIFVAFNIIVYSVFFRRLSLFTLEFKFLSTGDVAGVFLAAIFFPAVYGFLMGTEGVLNALGHMFLTHFEPVEPIKTILYWSAFFLLAIVTTKMVV